jgi:hypothetical protein
MPSFEPRRTKVTELPLSRPNGSPKLARPSARWHAAVAPKASDELRTAVPMCGRSEQGKPARSRLGEGSNDVVLRDGKSCPNRAHVREKGDTIDVIDGERLLILRKLQKRQGVSANPAYMARSPIFNDLRV